MALAAQGFSEGQRSAKAGMRCVTVHGYLSNGQEDASCRHTEQSPPIFDQKQCLEAGPKPTNMLGISWRPVHCTQDTMTSPRRSLGNNQDLF